MTGFSTPRPRHFHREDAGAVGDEAAAPADDAAHGPAGFRVRLERGVAHLLFDFETARLFLRRFRDRLVNVRGNEGSLARIFHKKQMEMVKQATGCTDLREWE